MGKKFIFGLSLLICSIILLSDSVNSQWYKVLDFNYPYSTLPSGLLTDNSGNIYVSGSRSDINEQYTTRDILIAKYSPEGNLLWMKFYNGPANDHDSPTNMIFDKTGNIIVTGISKGINSDFDYITLKYSPTGDLMWENRFDDSTHNYDYPIKVMVDDSNNVYVSGRNRLVSGETDINCIGVVKYSKNGNFIWNKYITGISIINNPVSAVIYSHTGETYHLGVYSGNSSNRIVLKKLDRNGQFIWDKLYVLYDNSIFNQPTSIIIDKTGDILIGSYTRIWQPSPILRTGVTKVNPVNGDTLWSRLFMQNKFSEELSANLTADNSGKYFISSELINTTLGKISTVSIDGNGDFNQTAINGSWIYPLNSINLIGFIDTVKSFYYTGARVLIQNSFYKVAIFKHNLEGDFIEYKEIGLPDIASIIFQNGITDKDGNLVLACYTDNFRKNLIIIKEKTNNTGIIKLGSENPQNFELLQNFPNPFNSTTNIRFNVPVKSKTTLKLYDIRGLEIETLINEIKEPGMYQVSYNAGDLSSGVYIYKLITERNSIMKKMVLIK